jgi:hypothetical protein
MDEWWSEIDGAVGACLSEIGGTSPDEIGRRLGMSEEAAVSILGMLRPAGSRPHRARRGRAGCCSRQASGQVDRRRHVSR